MGADAIPTRRGQAMTLGELAMMLKSLAEAEEDVLKVESQASRRNFHPDTLETRFDMPSASETCDVMRS